MRSIFPPDESRGQGKKYVLGLPCRRSAPLISGWCPGKAPVFLPPQPSLQTIKYLNLLKSFLTTYRPLALLLCAPFCTQPSLSWGLLSIGFLELCFLSCPSYLPMFLPPYTHFFFQPPSHLKMKASDTLLQIVANLGRPSFLSMLLYFAHAPIRGKGASSNTLYYLEL